MDLVPFDERTVATEDLQPRFWIETISQVDSASPSVTSHVTEPVSVEDVLAYAERGASHPGTRVNVYVLVGALSGEDLHAVRIATF